MRLSNFRAADGECRAMRICYVADGACIHTQRWVNHFAAKGHEVHLICWKLMPGYYESVHVHLLTRIAPKIWGVSQYPSFLLWVLQVRRLIKRINPDIVDGHFITVYGFLAACSGFHPLVVTSWGSDLLVQPERNPLQRYTARYALKRADTVVARIPVEDARAIITGLGGDPNSEIMRVVLGVNTEEFAPSRLDPNVREHRGMGPCDPLIISTRNLAPVYDVETLVKAIPLVLSEEPRARFMLAGAGAQQNYLQELASNLGVSASIEFIGWVPRAELPSYLSSADVYVSTSLSDGTPNSLLEAMACELPAIVTDIPANRPWVSDGENGFLFPARDHRALAARILDLLKHRQMRDQLGHRSRHLVQENAEERTQMAKLETIYHELVESLSSMTRRAPQQ